MKGQTDAKLRGQGIGRAQDGSCRAREAPRVPFYPATCPAHLQRGGEAIPGVGGTPHRQEPQNGSSGPPERGVQPTPRGLLWGALGSRERSGCRPCWALCGERGGRLEGTPPLGPGCRRVRPRCPGDSERAQGHPHSVGSGEGPGSSWAVGPGDWGQWPAAVVCSADTHRVRTGRGGRQASWRDAWPARRRTLWEDTGPS